MEEQISFYKETLNNIKQLSKYLILINSEDQPDICAMLFHNQNLLAIRDILETLKLESSNEQQ